jgi:phage/plasmid primase-like uncharacterized protein
VGVSRLDWLTPARSILIAFDADTVGQAKAKELAAAIDSLELATRGGKQVDPNAQVKELAGKIRELRLELSLGKKVSATKLDDVQKELDLLLRK